MDEHQHSYRVVVTRLHRGTADERVGLERHPTFDPLYFFRCAGCGDVQKATLDGAAERGWLELVDVP